MGMRRLIKRASYFVCLHSCVAKNGSPIEFIARILSGRLQYSIVMMHQFHDSSFYDGESFDDAFDLYVTIISRLYNVTQAENLLKQKYLLLNKAQKLVKETANHIYHQRNTLYFNKPLFLGINESC